MPHEILARWAGGPPQQTDTWKSIGRLLLDLLEDLALSAEQPLMRLVALTAALGLQRGAASPAERPPSGLLAALPAERCFLARLALTSERSPSQFPAQLAWITEQPFPTIS
jgi:hypothetical protein